jgi:hypothetical protein
MVVNPSVPAKSVPEFIAYAKANPRKLNMASPGTGTGPHIAGELSKMMAGVEMVHAPYRGIALALNDQLGGQVQVSFAFHALVDPIHQGRPANEAAKQWVRHRGLKLVFDHRGGGLHRHLRDRCCCERLGRL